MIYLRIVGIVLVISGIIGLVISTRSLSGTPTISSNSSTSGSSLSSSKSSSYTALSSSSMDSIQPSVESSSQNSAETTHSIQNKSSVSSTSSSTVRPEDCIERGCSIDERDRMMNSLMNEKQFQEPTQPPLSR